jgi:LmbE family N-acetylglucosaminyl deacetylase
MTDESGPVLVVAPHPDDAEIGAGGTIAKWISEGRDVFYVVTTNGDKGSSDPEMTSEKLAAIREKEQMEAAKVLGVKEVTFLGYPDGELEDTPQFREQLVSQIRKHRPYTVMTTDFLERYRRHKDHRITGRVVMDAVFPSARDRLFFPEHQAQGLGPHKVREVYVWGSDAPNTFIDISNTIEKKVAALGCHGSQISGLFTGRLEERLREWAARVGKENGMPLAEAFHKVEFSG